MITQLSKILLALSLKSFGLQKCKLTPWNPPALPARLFADLCTRAPGTQHLCTRLRVKNQHLPLPLPEFLWASRFFGATALRLFDVSLAPWLAPRCTWWVWHRPCHKEGPGGVCGRRRMRSKSFSVSLSIYIDIILVYIYIYLYILYIYIYIYFFFLNIYIYIYC